MKKHAVYLTVDELTDIIIAYDGRITLLKENRRKMKESTIIKEKFPHMPKLYTDSIEKAEATFKKFVQIRNDCEKIEREEQTKMTNEEKRWNALPDIDNETVKIWLDKLLEDKNKMYVEELTIDEIKAEIEETKGSMDNFRVWGDRHAIVDCEEYLEVLEEMLNNKEEQ